MAVELTTAEATLESGMKVSCKSRGFEITLDEPEADGGTNAGMNPVEALLSSLGGCLTIVAKSFARVKKIKLKSFKVNLEGELDSDGYLGKNPNAKKGSSKIKTTFHVEADNTEEEIKDFIDFVLQTCPVHDTIVNTPDFETEIVTS